jgi:hypothetical protein
MNGRKLARLHAGIAGVALALLASAALAAGAEPDFSNAGGLFRRPGFCVDRN